MLNRVPCHASDLGPGLSLHAELVVGCPSLEHGLLSPAAARDDADHGPAPGADGLLLTAGETDAGAAEVGKLGDHDAVLARSPRDGTAVAELFLNVAHDRTL